MNSVVHKIILQSDRHFGGKLPPHHLGFLLAELPIAVCEAISMGLRNRSAVRGRRPAWLDRAADVRFVDHEGNGTTTLYFEAPRLGDAAPEVYRQQELPGLSFRPAAEDTGFDLLGDVLVDVMRGHADSEHFDPALLDRVMRFQRVFSKRSPFTEIDVTSRRYTQRHPARISTDLIESAKSLLGKTPAPHRIRLVGQLDGLEASTQRFSVLLDSGEKVVGVFGDDQIDVMQELWRKRVLVLGSAVYRASGRLLRIDAQDVRLGESESSVFSKLPQPSNAKLDLGKLRKAQGPKSGMAAIMGKWPGDETEEEIAAALEQLS